MRSCDRIYFACESKMSAARDFIEQCLNHLYEPENKRKIEQIVIHPSLEYVYEHLYTNLYARLLPYLRVISGLYILIIVLLIVIIYLIVRRS